MLKMNELGEFLYEFDAYKPMKLRYSGKHNSSNDEQAVRPTFGTRECPECHKKFVANTRNHMYCCPKCGEEYRKKNKCD